MLLGLLASSAAAVDTAREEEVKAAYLVNFARYVEWPDEAFAGDDDPIVIGVLSGEDLASAVRGASRSKRIQGRPVVVAAFEAAAEVGPCHLLFIGEDREEQADEALDRLEDVPVFSIADYGGASRYEAMASFVRQGRKLRFEIDDRLARRRGLKISSRLLRLGR